MTGKVSETYVAAIQHDLVDLEEATPVGVVRRPTGWFHGVVTENLRELGPPETLLDELSQRREDFAMGGMCDEGAHNAAWEETEFAERYQQYLDSDATAAAAIERLQNRLRDGEDIVLVCFEADGKRCHRHRLCEMLRETV